MIALSGNSALAAAKLLRGAAASQGVALPAHRVRARSQALELVEREGLLNAAWRWSIVPLDESPSETLRAGGEAFHAPWLLPKTGELTALAFAVCTIGPALEMRVRSLFTERRPSLALALDALGNELLFAVSRRAQDLLQAEVKRAGLSMAGELRPGDPGLGLEAQGGGIASGQGGRDRRCSEPAQHAEPDEIGLGDVRRWHRSAARALVALRSLPVAQDLQGCEAGNGVSMSATETFALSFPQLGRTVAARGGETVFQAARRNGVRVVGACGGRGTCGSCMVLVREGETHRLAR